MDENYIQKLKGEFYVFLVYLISTVDKFGGLLSLQ